MYPSHYIQLNIIQGSYKKQKRLMPNYRQVCHYINIVKYPLNNYQPISSGARTTAYIKLVLLVTKTAVSKNHAEKDKQWLPMELYK